MIRRSFLFEADVSLLGECTRYFQSLAYTRQSISEKGPTWFATLHGHLVDRTKQGNRFTKSAYQTLKERKDLVKDTPRMPAYLKSEVPNHDLDDIIDYLKFGVARQWVDHTLGRLHSLFTDADFKDEDLLGPQRQLQKLAENDPILKEASAELEKEVGIAFGYWERASSGGDQWDDARSARFRQHADRALEHFEAIQPPSGDHPLLRSWQMDANTSDWSEWKLLKASVAYHKSRLRNKFPWYVAGKLLTLLKSRATNNLRCMGADLYPMFKPDSKFIQRKKDSMVAETKNDDLSEDEYESAYGEDFDD